MKKHSFFAALLIVALSMGISSCETTEPVEDLTVKLDSTTDTDGGNGNGDPDGDSPGNGTTVN